MVNTPVCGFQDSPRVQNPTRSMICLQSCYHESFYSFWGYELNNVSHLYLYLKHFKTCRIFLKHFCYRLSFNYTVAGISNRNTLNICKRILHVYLTLNEWISCHTELLNTRMSVVYPGCFTRYTWQCETYKEWETCQVHVHNLQTLSCPGVPSHKWYTNNQDIGEWGSWWRFDLTWATD